ncbi:MAG: imidazolonepropionase [Elusimicrobia bacterium RIFOXYB2_FULL_62_6]|nr:MAG: imidazolonepropionase [Elusimicrobia bacterium RIFOXYB2_FULL_62_6]
MALLITGLDQLLTFKGPAAPRCGRAQGAVGLVKGGAVLSEGGLICAAGPEKEVLRHPLAKKARVIRTKGVAMPAFVDSHTHAVFAEPRLRDFSLRTQGAAYAEIKAKGGGIISSVRAVRRQRPADTAAQLLERAERFLECGTGTVEVKTGYGLDRESELKILYAVKAAAARTRLEMLPTLLSAHAVPPEFGGTKEYLLHIVSKILPEVSANGLAVFADIFCEKGYFSPEESFAYLQACKAAGLIPKIHAEQLSLFGGTLAGAAAGAVSADHLDHAGKREMAAMRRAGTVAALLPASNYFLGLSKYPDARAFIAAGVPVALATDFNPGTSPCWNMQFVLSAACTQMKMTPEEALCAATVNGAAALGASCRLGSLQPGLQADIAVFDASDYRELCYYFGANLNKLTVKKGQVVYQKA